MKQLALATLLSFSVFGIQAQQKVQDSLRNAYINARSDTEKTNTIRAIVRFYMNHDEDSLLHYTKLLNEIATKESLDEVMMTVNAGFGIYLIRKRKYDSALHYFKQNIDAAKKLGDYENLSKNLNNIGGLNFTLGRYENALNYYIESLNISKSVEGYDVSSELNNIGLVYHSMNNYEKAIAYFRESFSYSKPAGNINGLLNAYSNIARSYVQYKKQDSALHYYHKGLTLAESLSNTRMVAVIFRNIAALHLKENLIDSSRIYYDKLFDIHKAENNMLGLANAYSGYGELLYEVGKYAEAINMHMLAKNIYDSLNEESEVSRTLYNLAVNHYELGQYKNAYEKLHENKVLSDTLNIRNNTAAMSEMLVMYETEKKEERNRFLQLENEVKERSIATQKRTILIQGILVAVLLVLLAVLVVLLYKFAQQRKKLKTANQAKDKLFNIISHDLRGPVGNLKALTEFLIEDVSSRNDSEFESILKENKELIDSTYNMINDLLAWSLSQKEGLIFKPGVINLKQLVEKNIAPLKHLTKNKEIELNINIDDDTTVLADESAVSTVVRNLITNAIKFTPRGGSISISTKANNSMHEVCVSDTGIGMNSDQLKGLFKIKEVGKSTGTENEIGSGIGLTFCKDIVKQSGGEIWVKSKIDIGSSFYFTLPST